MGAIAPTHPTEDATQDIDNSPRSQSRSLLAVSCLASVSARWPTRRRDSSPEPCPRCGFPATPSTAFSTASRLPTCFSVTRMRPSNLFVCPILPSPRCSEDVQGGGSSLYGPWPGQGHWLGAESRRASFTSRPPFPSFRLTPGAHDSAVLSHARRIAQLPLSLGGLGLMSACWASWAGFLPVLGQHLPLAAQSFLRDLEAPVPLADHAGIFLARLRPALPPGWACSRREPKRERLVVLVARCSVLLSHAASSAFAAAFAQRAEPLSHADGVLPPLGELLANVGEAPLTVSRLHFAQPEPPKYKWLPWPEAPFTQFFFFWGGTVEKSA